MTNKIITIGDGAVNIAKLISIETSKTIIIATLGGRKSLNVVDIIRAHKDRDPIVIVVMPMCCEGITRNRRADEQKARIETVAKNIMTFSNETYSHLPIKQAFTASDCDVREFIYTLNYI